jgi:hypothetical protein
MQPEGSILFRSRGEFNEAVLAAMAATRRELVLADRDFSDWPLDTAEGNAALETFLLGDPQARLRVLVADPDWLERRAARFHASRRRHPGAILCRLIPPSLFGGEGVVIGDRRHLLRRAHHDFFRGRLSLGLPAEVDPVAGRWDALWDESTPILASTTLGL